MAEFKKNSKNSFWHSPIVLLVLFGLIMLFIYNIVGLIRTEKETARKKDLVLEEISSLNERQQNLVRDIDRLETEEGIEDIIREKYQVVKQGEKMVVIVDKENEEKESEVSYEKHGFWNWLSGLFKN